MRITGWTEWDNPAYKEAYPIGMDSGFPYEISAVRKLISEELRNKGYKFTGSYHQEGDFGVPIIDGEWLCQFTCRSWGDIMAMAYPEEIDDSDGLGYVVWAWIPPDSCHSMIVPSS